MLYFNPLLILYAVQTIHNRSLSSGRGVGLGVTNFLTQNLVGYGMWNFDHVAYFSYAKYCSDHVIWGTYCLGSLELMH